MANKQKEIDEILDTQGSLLEGIRLDYRKLIKGNKASVARMRKAQMSIAKYAKEVRQLLLEHKESM